MIFRPATLDSSRGTLRRVGLVAPEWRRKQGQISNQTHYYKRLRLGNSWEVSSDLGGSSASEDFQVDRQVLLGILPDRRDQVSGFHQHLVGVVVQRRIDHQLARSPFTFIDAIENGIQAGDGGVELLRQLLVFGQLTERTLSGVDVGNQLVGFGHGLVRVVVERRIFDEFAHRALSAVDLVDGLVKVIDRQIGLVVELVAIEQLADAAVRGVCLCHDLLQLGEHVIGAIEQRRIVNHLANRTLSALDVRQDTVQALHQRVNVLQGPLTRAHHILQLRDILRGQLGAVHQRTTLGLAAVHIHEDLAQYAGSVQRSLAIGPHRVLVLSGDLHNHFDGSEFAQWVVNHADANDISYVNALEPDRSSHAQPAGVVNVGADENLLGEQTSSAGHQEDQNGQRDTGDDDGQSNPQLRPFHLFLARHVLTIAPSAPRI